MSSVTAEIRNTPQLRQLDNLCSSPAPTADHTTISFGQHMQNATALQSHLLSLYIPYLGDPLLQPRAQPWFSFLVTNVLMKIKNKISHASVFQYCGPFWNTVLNAERVKSHEEPDAGS